MKKVSFTQLRDFKSIGGTVLPILDAGLPAPYGITWDAPRSALYVCDGILRKIFRAKLKAVECVGSDCKGIPYKLSLDGDLVAVVEDTLSQWATVDESGNLYFSDQDSSAIKKVNVENINLIVDGILSPKDLKKTTEPEVAGEEAAKEAKEESPGDEKASITTLTTPAPTIMTLYEKGASPHVGTPSGVCASGPQLFWANQVGGFGAGSVSYGKTKPRVKVTAEGDDKPTFPSAKMVNNTASAYGIALTSSKIIYSDTSHYIWAASRGTGEAVALTKEMLKPRGIVFDGDNTVYVADQEANLVGSIPVGLLRAGAPVTHALDIHAPFGLALVGKLDPVWDSLRAKYGDSGANRLASLGAFVTLVVALALTLQ